MGSFTISFRIADEKVGGRTYDERYAAVVDAIKAMVKGKYWDRTTAFLAIQSEYTIDQIAAACKAKIAPTHDLALILNADVKEGRITGKNDDPDIFTIIPSVKAI